MIKIVLESRYKRNSPPPIVYPQVSPIRQLDWKEGPVGAILDEAVRRDKIIQEEYINCPYPAGAECVPETSEGFEDYGVCTVTHLAASYAEYGKEEWPTSDKPLIVSAFSQKKQVMFFCTTNYLKKVENTSET